MEALETACSLSYYFAAAVTETDSAATETAVISSGCCSSSPAADAAMDSASAETPAAVDETPKIYRLFLNQISR